MPQFSHRSTKEELLDQPGISAEDLHQNLKELDTINRLLGGHDATIYGLKQLINDSSKTYTIVDYACGGGDTLRKIERWAKAKAINVKLIGFDLLPEAIAFARKNSPNSEITFLVSDFNTFSTQGDIAICSLVCHHFYGDTLKRFVLSMKQNSSVGVVINDLHRHPLAYYGISILTQLFSKSHLVKNDARLSVLKGFTSAEWKKNLKKWKVSNYTIKWIWAFRHAIILKND